MKLDAWINDVGTTAAAFSQRVGVSHSTVSRWLSGKVLPSPRTMRLITAATDGLVTPNDMLSLGMNVIVESEGIAS